MIYPFFELAGRSPTRQRTFLQLAVVHVLVVAGLFCVLSLRHHPRLIELLGHALIMLGIVEGAIVIGWRLTQWPKSPALEIVLVSPLSSRLTMIGEQLVGLTILLLISLAAAPVLLLGVSLGWLNSTEAAVMIALGLLSGFATGLGMVAWAYERKKIRALGEKLLIAGILFFIIVGGMVGEKSFRSLSWLPFDLGAKIQDLLMFFNNNNPFGLVHRIGIARESQLWLNLISISLGLLAISIAFFLRSAFRLKEHYVDLHHSPTNDHLKGPRGDIANHPLSWWAIRRVHQYSGRINLFLAGGATAFYSAYIILGDRWPAWLGKGVFRAFDMMGGVPSLASAMFVLAAVPAAYQFGLWDSSAAARVRRIELLLLTDLRPRDYLHATWSASWSRGRGYFAFAILLLFAGYWSNKFPLTQTICAAVAGATLLCFYAAIGFRFLARSNGGTLVGFFLSIALPLATWGLAKAGFESIARCLPPGLIYYSLGDGWTWLEAICCSAYLGTAIVVFSTTLQRFDHDLREWYATLEVA